ncbi:RNA-binding protein 42 isoform X2 [Gopherus flavomarginatus]|uniref:RNA-binding protein 42 isoform X2 n=1 Tax=Gopherus flavomarginatus TaxID=286002 RepID=UPI0021CBB3C1|nr:RNA-binding protein 42 isoform X2 [Gopherus flavomarginatus]
MAAPPAPPPAPGPGPAGGAAAAGGPKSGEERLKEMEAEMALFEQEVLGAPVSLPSGAPVVEAVPVALAVPAVPTVPPVPVIRPIIATNTYQQVQQSLEARAAAAATVVAPIVAPPVPFVGPVVPPQRPPILRPAFVPHVLQRSAGAPRPLAMRPPHHPAMVGPPMPGPQGPQMMMGPPMQRPPGPLMGPIGPMRTGPPVGPGVPIGPITPLMSVPRPPVVAAPKINPMVIQAAPTVYSAPPVKKQEEELREQPPPVVVEEKEPGGLEEAVIGPSMPEVEPVMPEARVLPALRGPELGPIRGRRPRGPEPGFAPVEPVVEPVVEDKKKTRQEKLKRCIRTAAGSCWEDSSLLEWDSDDFRIFCGDLGNEVNDDILARAFSRYPSFLKAKVIRDKRTGKTKGYGFVSFKDPNDYVRAMREMNGKYVGSRPIKLRKSMWKDRNIDVVRKKQKEKKKLGLR